MERTNLNDLALEKFLGPVAQLGWSVRLINLIQTSKGREFESHSAHISLF